MNQEPQKRLRLAVLLSGQGSNAEALAKAAEDSAYPAEIVLVASDKPEAAGLAKAQARGLATWAWHRKPEDTKQKDTKQADQNRFDRRSFEAALVRVLDKHQVEALALAGFMRILSADFLAGFANTRGGKADYQYSPFAPATLSRLACACPSPCRRGRRNRSHSPSGHRRTRRRSDSSPSNRTGTAG